MEAKQECSLAQEGNDMKRTLVYKGLQFVITPEAEDIVSVKILGPQLPGETHSYTTTGQNLPWALKLAFGDIAFCNPWLCCWVNSTYPGDLDDDSPSLLQRFEMQFPGLQRVRLNMKGPDRRLRQRWVSDSNNPRYNGKQNKDSNVLLCLPYFYSNALQHVLIIGFNLFYLKMWYRLIVQWRYWIWFVFLIKKTPLLNIKQWRKYSYKSSILTCKKY